MYLSCLRGLNEIKAIKCIEKDFTPSAKAWINQTFRPITSCIKDHFNDDVERFFEKWNVKLQHRWLPWNGRRVQYPQKEIIGNHWIMVNMLNFCILIN
jgi:hypothetical protein